MRFNISCPTCEAALVVSNAELIGKILACPKCGGMVLIEPPKTAESPESSEPEPPAEIEPPILDKQPPEEPEPEIVPVKISKEQRFRQLFIIVLAVLVVLLLLLFLILQFAGGKKPPENPEPPPVIEVPVTDPEDDPITESPDEPEEEIDWGNIHSEEGDFQLKPGVEQEQTEEPDEPVEIEDEQPEPEDFVEQQPEQEESFEVEPPRAPLIEWDPAEIEAQLALPVKSIAFEKTPFAEAISTLSRSVNVPITLDTAALRFRGYPAGAPITMKMEQTTIGEVLDTIIDKTRLIRTHELGQIYITLPESELNTFVESEYEIADLIEAGFTTEKIVEIIERMIAPKSWKKNGGEGNTVINGTKITVKQTAPNLDETLRLLEQIRVIRGLTQKTERIEARLAPEVFGWDKLGKPLSLHYLRPQRITTVLQDIRRKTGLNILIDHLAIRREGDRIENIESTVHSSENQTIDSSLSELLSGADLTYRIIDSGTIEVTTPYESGKPENMYFEVHPLRGAKAKLSEEDAAELISVLKKGIAPNTWNIEGNPETLGFGDVIYDRNSGCLLVRQSQPVQRMIRKWTKDGG